MTMTLSDRQRSALREFKRRAVDRAQRERDIESGFRQRTQALQKEDQDTRQRIEEAQRRDQEAARSENEEARRLLVTQYEATYQQYERDFQRTKQRAIANYLDTKAKTESGFKEARWTINTLYEADKKVAMDQVEQMQRQTKAVFEELHKNHRGAGALLDHWQLADDWPLFLDSHGAAGSGDPWNQMRETGQRSQAALEKLRAMKSPAWLKGLRPWLATFVVWALACLPALLIEDPLIWLAGATALVWPLGLALRWFLLRRARRRVGFAWQLINQATVDGKSLRRQCMQRARLIYRQLRVQAKERQRLSLKHELQKARNKIQAARTNRDQLLRQAQETYKPLLEQIDQKHQLDLTALADGLRQQLAQIEQQRLDELREFNDRMKKGRDENNRRHAQEWTRLVEDWKEGCDQFRQELQLLEADCRRYFPPWKGNGFPWQPPIEMPTGLLLGELGFNLERVPAAIPQDPHLPRLELNGAYFPALLPFPERASVLFLAQDQGKPAALEALQALLFRAWTALPPGKLKCTILDPVGRGENFATFMHLADHDESLVTSRIWTEAAHIEERLNDLTTHMETVLQKFLRNQYQTLAEYNAQAEEVAEPFRLVVAADFPINYTPDACRRLISLASAGPRCGIYVFVLADTKHPLPQGIDMDDLARACTVLNWQQDRFAWEDDDFSPFPLSLERLPPAEVCTQVLQKVGLMAKLASRVEVPFGRIAPAPERWWTANTRQGIQVSLGRSGATGQQLLTLGQGTSQHALVAGKTGSGKSTLLHVLITQLALSYSPEEIELYLVDFKKGVEFKTYAAHALPHARVVAVESEREFGLSVLQRLDAELVRRGDMFRTGGVSDLPSYRAAFPHQPLPRILLIVDEFQEFFVEDDKVAQEAALLLDRLVRQGRAFGIHIFLGSQTLGGAYSLARSTIDQMAVRIALQCSEADAHLILSKDNAEARLLSRPGEAIYNSANGMLEGNNLFQIVWLNDDQRDQYLGKVSELAAARHWQPAEPQIVFEGNAPSDLANNQLLARMMEKPQTAPRSSWHAWLGEAVAIKDPTSALFRKHSGANLLILGQHDEAALSMFASAALSLGPQVRYQRLEDLLPMHLTTGVALEKGQEYVLNRLPDVVPLKVHSQRDLPAILERLNLEVEKRIKGEDGPPLFLFLYGLQRLRDLRRPEDDFGFSRKGDEKPSPYKLFMNLVKEGPALGVFTIIWCDNLGNLQRTIDRQALREFEMRVLFQMSAADSSTLTDNPMAAKLGPNRALLYTEDQGRMEKFRPYGLPTRSYLDSLQG